MIKLKSGEHTNYTSKNGIPYWVMNCKGKYIVYKRSNYCNPVKVTKEIMENIELV